MTEQIRLVAGSDDRLSEVGTTFESLVEQQQTRLFGALCLVTGDRYEAEEIMQESFVRVLERWERVGKMDSPEAYLFQVAMNVFRTKRRRATMAVRRMIGVAPDPDVFSVVDDRETVMQALAGVSSDQRAALVITALYGLGSAEAGRVLGVRPSTVRARASRARTALRRAIGEDR